MLSAIVKWSPKQDVVVGLHLAGKSNSDIAEATGFTVVRVSQIINDPTGQRLIQDGQKRLRLKMHENIGDRVLEMADKGSKKLMETIEADFNPGTDAKKHQDNKVIDILKGTGFLSPVFTDDSRDTSAVTNNVAKMLTEAIQKATEAERYKEDIPTVDFEIIQDG